jgi:NitT/TauT family transport system ATP-binding protein
MRPDVETPPSAIELASVSVSFPSTTTALENVSFAVPRGRFVSVVGPTGCGKSTVLNCVAGLRTPTSGEVLIDRVPLRGLNRRRTYTNDYLPR